MEFEGCGLEMGRTSQEAVQLHQELEVDIVALRRLTVAAANVMVI